jgi:hypothetical protein
VDLLAQKRSLFAPKQSVGELITQATGGSELGQLNDLGILAGIAMLVVWAIATFMFEAPGWVHLLLSAGVFLIIYRIVVRGTPGVDTTIKKD